MFHQVADKYEKVMLMMNYCHDENIKMSDDIMSEITVRLEEFIVKMVSAIEGGDAEKMESDFDYLSTDLGYYFEKICNSMGQDYCHKVFSRVYDVLVGFIIFFLF